MCDVSVRWSKQGGPKSSVFLIRPSIFEIYEEQHIQERIFKALFTYVSTQSGLRSFDKCFENIVANKKSRFQPLVKMGMKTVDKHIDKKNKQ